MGCGLLFAVLVERCARRCNVSVGHRLYTVDVCMEVVTSLSNLEFSFPTMILCLMCALISPLTVMCLTLHCSAADVIYDNVDADANIIFGALVDEKITNGEVRSMGCLGCEWVGGW